MAAVGFVHTVARIAEMLGVDEERLDALALGLEPEDGRLWVYGPGEEATLAFTPTGVERLQELLADQAR